MSEQRFETLEIKMMAAEDQLDELNRIVWRQQQELERLRAQLQALALQLGKIQPGAGELQAGDEIPPHW